MEKRKEESMGEFSVVSNHPQKSEEAERSVRQRLYEVYRKYRQEEMR